LTIVIPFTTYWLARHTNLTRAGSKIETTSLKPDEQFNLADEEAPKKDDKKEEGGTGKIPAPFPTLPKVEGAVERSLKQALPDVGFSQHVATAAQDVYETVFIGPDYNLSFYLAAILLGLTCISWAMHTTWGCQRRARPVH
jgi:hypothetical protein